jgi:Zn-dependent peptidase ImmA (M78 family)
MRTRGEIEERVAELLQKHSISSIPVPVDAIAVAENVLVLEQTFNGDLSGALIKSNGLSAIAVNGAHSSNRKRFTIAHELGHHLLTHKGDEDHVDWEFTVLRRDGKSSEASNAQEIEANIFAACLLMPKASLSADLKIQTSPNGVIDLARDQIAALARKYQVSEIAMNYRLINLGFLSPI